MTRKEEIQKTRTEMTELHTKLMNLVIEDQKECKHEKLYKWYTADTGNWCPNDDVYYVSVFCNECDSSWEADTISSPSEYGRLSNLKGMRVSGFLDIQNHINDYHVNDQ